MTIPGTIGEAANLEFIKNKVDWKQELTQTEFDTWRDHLLANWDKAKATLELAKASEMESRKAVVSFAFDPDKKSGTERIELANGYQAKAVKKLNYGFVKASDGKLNKLAIDAALNRIEKADPAGAFIAERLVKWEPTLSLTEYKELPPNLKTIIDEVIVTTEGAPSLEIIPPKGK